MTSIYFDPAQFGAPSEPEPREQLIVNGRYYLPPIGDPTGKRRSLQRVTNFIKQLSDEGGLVKWKLRSTIIGLAVREDFYDLACSIDPNHERGKYELDQLIERCIDAAKAYQGSGGNETGTALHNLTDNVGHSPLRVRPKWVPKVENYHRALHDKGLRVVQGLSERLVVSEKFGTCGRLDDVYEDPFGTLRVGDRKSQKEFYTWWEVGAQLALYQCSDAMWNEQTSSWEDMPKLADDYAHVAWMPLQHPAAAKGGDVDTVTIYDLPLSVPREVLDWCARVRELRTGARRWGQERPDLDAFAVTAREIRDAETLDDLRKIAACRQIGVNWSDELHQPMAAKRWEELTAQASPEPVATPLNDAVRVSTVSSYSFGEDKTQLTVSGSHDAMTELVRQADAVRAMSPVDVQQMLHHTQTATAPPAVREIAPTPDMLAHAADLSQRVREVARRATVSAEALGFDPALFVAPEGEGASFQGSYIDALVDDLEGGGSSNAVPAAGGAQLGGPALSEGEPTPYQEPRPELGIAAGWDDEGGVLRKPTEWMAYLGLQGMAIQADGDGVWCKPMPVKSFRSIYAKEIEEFERTSKPPVVAVPYTHSKHSDAVVVELPDAETAAINAASDAHALDSVPIKIVREVATRAANSKSSRGRVRLLNDVEEKKYAKHAEALLPALLREWLVIDGLNGEPGFNKDGIPRVANTGGSSREPMDARRAGRVSLSEYLELKGEATTPAQGDKLPTLQEATKIIEAHAGTIGDPAHEPLPGDRPVHLYGETQAVRRKYADITPDKHSLLRLVEMAKQAENGAERAKVFHEITRRKAWTGEIAAEINQHYLDNGYATEDFDPYFEASALPDTQIIEVIPPPASNNGTSPAEAIAQLQACRTLADLQDKWEAIAKLPCWQDGTVQETAFAMMSKVKA